MYTAARRLAMGLAILLLLCTWAAGDPPDPKEKLVTVGKLQGKLAKLPGTEQTMTLGLLVGRNKWQNQELPIVDELQVRVLHPPTAFDDKGKPRKYSSKEL